MRYPKEHKAETRKKIVSAAARLFRQRGYEGVGVDAVMNELGLTAGGFYAHFPSKEALFAEAMATSLGGEKNPRASSRRASTDDSLKDLIFSYLSRTHRDSVAEGCPLPALTTDVTRASSATREIYEQKLKSFLNSVESVLPTGATRDTAIAVIAQCVGGLMISRAVSDQEFSNRILKACRAAAMKIATE
ncbi:MAG: TetR/AcrR family transcriptional regulator [Acidobacteriota bacterium]